MKHQNINVIENGIKITLNLGRQGEYNVRDIKFDMSDFKQKYGDGTATIVHYPAKGSAYTVPSIAGDSKDSAILDNDTLTWTIGKLATRYDGKGIAEITWTTLEGLKKSVIYNTYCKEAIGDYGADRAAQQSYIDQMVELASTITDLSGEFSDAERIAAEIVDARENAVSDIEALKNEAVSAVNTAKSESIEDIGDSKESALDALNTAKQTALSDVESAKQDAETDINAAILIAETHANNASQSATNASNSAASASNSADSASQSAASAQTSATNASNSAASASQFADNASSSANSAGQSATSAQTSATNASASEQSARQSAETAQDILDSVQAEGDIQINRVQSEGNTQIGRVQAKGNEILNSLPSDFTQVQNDIAALNGSLDTKVDLPSNGYGISGKVLRSTGTGTEWATIGQPTDAQAEEAVSNWLNEHPEATTTVQDGSLTENKFSETLKLKTVKEYYTPEMFGAKGDGITDDILYIETMLNSVPDNAECVFYNNYYISHGVTITRPVNIIMYGTLRVAPQSDFCVRLSGHDVRKNKFRLNLAVNSSSQSQWDGTYSTIGLDCYATWENEIYLVATGFNVGIRMYSTDQDCTYNKVFVRSIYNCKTAILLSGDDTLRGGTTAQNTFIGGRIGTQGSSYNWLNSDDINDYYAPIKSVLVGNRTNNNNNFISCSFEGFGAKESPYENRARIIANILYCVFIGCRYEDITAFYSNNSCAVISGYGFDQIPTVSGLHSSVGTYQTLLSSFTRPIILKRTGNTGEYLKVKDYQDRDVLVLDSNYYAHVRGISISAANKSLFNDSGRLKVLSTRSDVNSLTSIGNGELFIGNAGYIKHKNLAGYEYVYEPIRTKKPSTSSQLVTGMMVFSNGKPQWWDGSKWIYADGTEAT